ncbi:IMPACT family protein [Campylobacter sp. IFREMER_LSEM_CL1904]|uniref:IMPACT family protein n=1 Tax=unclassified Campylobacter TaxID=2593542 RepID=UPI0021E65E60|nr:MULTISPECIES: YigZ family protein [unclassified Campylobacter]MCV3427301.1 IMPACT family protein [Campylobacter sp. IFREMER_LSEM_CL1904]MCV3479328.1 IMPACT family protein [Campylobacter sp. CNRCH_2015_1657]
MKTIDQIYQATIEIKKSTFLSFLCPFEDFQTLMQKLRNEHLKAVHFVYAYRYLNEFDQIIEDKSDDGEPKGTSAMPCLNVLRGALLINCAVIVVRYFGGIKLGTGGLVRAYSEATNEAILNAMLLEFEAKNILSLNIPFYLYARFEHFLNKNNISYEKKFQENVELILSVNTKEEEEFKKFAKEFEFSGLVWK